MSLFQTVSHGVKRYLVIEKQIKNVQNIIKKVRYNVKKYIKSTLRYLFCFIITY